MNKYKLYMIVCICILVLSVGGSLAWYVWTSSSTYLSLNMCVPEISFIGGDTINGVGLKPIADKEQGLKKQIDVYLNKVCKEGDSAVMNLYMTLDSLPTELKHETFIFEVVKDNIILYSGNFKDKEEGTTITLLEDQVITEDTSTYWVYVYIDGTRDNPVNMSGKSFRFSVYGEGTNAIYKENVIANHTSPTDSSSVFLTSTLKRSEIEAITIAETNEVPEELTDTAEDISSNEDGSVMLWYEDTDDDELYEVYIGSDNDIVMANTNGEGMFAYLENVEYLDLTNLDTSSMINMRDMFKESKNLKEIKLSNFDTSNVTNMGQMFLNCSSLTTIDLSNFDTSKVTRIWSMFNGCSALTALDLSSFDTSNVTDMIAMFKGCTSLTSLDLSSFDTSNVTNMCSMFDSCASLTSLDLSNFNTSNVIDMTYMFSCCSSLLELDLSNFDTLNVTNMARMFYNCSSLTSLDLSNFVTSKVTDMAEMFRLCGKIEVLDVSNFDTSQVTHMGSVFNSCYKLKSLDLSKWNTSKVWHMGAMFCECDSLTELDLSNFDTSKVTTMTYMFWGCDNLRILDVSNFNTSNVTDMSYMIGATFYMKELDLSSFDTSKVTNMYYMFQYNTSLKTIYVSDKWTTNALPKTSSMFEGSTNLVGGSGTTYNASNINSTYARIDGGTTSPGYFTYKASTV